MQLGNVVDQMEKADELERKNKPGSERKS